MPNHSYSYDGLTAVLLAIGRLFGTAFALLGLGVAVLAITVFVKNPNASGVLCFGLAWCLGAIFGGFFFVFNYPDVTAEERGVRLRSWPYPPFFVPWSEVFEVQEYHGLKRNVVFVRVKRLSLLHLLYGLYGVRRLQAGFLIRKDIRGLDDLLRRLRQKSL